MTDEIDDIHTDVMRVLSYMALAQDKLDEISYKGADTEALQQMLKDDSKKIWTTLLEWLNGADDEQRKRNMTAHLYTTMRLELIRNCPECRTPRDEFDAGEYCHKHREFERLDDTIFDNFVR